MTIRTILQRSTGILTVSFYEGKHDPTPPLRAVYRIDDITTGLAIEVHPDTDFIVPVNGEYGLKLTADDTDIINGDNEREFRRVSVIGFYNQSEDEVPGVYDFEIKRLQMSAVG